jgi:hypothetical protein
MRKEYMWFVGGVLAGYIVLPKVMAAFQKKAE